MPKYLVSRRQITDWEVVVDANDEDEVMEIISDGVEWTFIQSEQGLDKWEEANA